MTAVPLEQHPATGYMRPFDMRRDLEALADLVEIAFGPELAATSSDIVQDLRQMALWGSTLWMAGPFAALYGFVWIEAGQLVGNVNLNQESGLPGTWTISNVAVLPAYRARGIAGRLLDQAIAYVRNLGGQRILLQVRADNPVALALYQHRGFVDYDTLHELYLPRNHWPSVVGPESFVGGEPFPLRRVRATDARSLYRLVLSSRPPAAVEQRPISRKQFRRGLWWRLQQALQAVFVGREFSEWVGEAGGEIVAYGTISAHLFRGPHALDLQVLPHQRGSWELPLAQSLLASVEALPRQSVHADISASHPEALQALHQLGFNTTRVLTQMALNLSRASQGSRKAL
jgi:ribosomal protein S18 acetylase RimI-like enzyme